MMHSAANEMGIELLNVEDFDFNVLHRTKVKGSDATAFTVTSRKNPNFTFAAFEVNGRLINPVIVKVGNAKRGVSVEYVDYSNLVTLEIREGDSGLAFSRKSFGDQSARNARRYLGQATMDCVTDAYSQHGWSSLFVSVATAFQPGVLVGIASYCAGKNLGC